MRKLYIQFPNVYALRKELCWTHYRSLIRVENLKAREVYMNEAADNTWSTRYKISTLYSYRGRTNKRNNTNPHPDDPRTVHPLNQEHDCGDADFYVGVGL